jgi:catechol 2,3-dioxygenase-like lactoylglutathione lyase family enzyme
MSFRILRVDHVQLSMPAGQDAAAREFFAGVLGLREVEKPAALKVNGGLWFDAGHFMVHLGVEEISALSKHHPAFEVDSLSAARTALEAAGRKIHEETPIPGFARFSFRDPFGNRIELLQRT